MYGKLTLIPTPIDEENPLEQTAFDLLNKASKDENSLILIEDLKPGRRRWLRWGLPREQVEKFVLYNEHTRIEIIDQLISHLKSGKNLFLMSDGGLPAFCDPGKELVSRCHDEKIIVTSSPFSNSISLAIALSGFQHDQFVFAGFLPRKSEDREKALKELINEKRTIVLMDTPYRLNKLLDEVRPFNRRVFLGINLNQSNEVLLRGNVQSIQAKVKGLKEEFILIIE